MNDYQYRKLIQQTAAFIDSNTRKKVDVISLSTLPSDKLLQIKPDGFDDTKWKDGCRWIIHSLLNMTLSEKYKDEQNRFFPLCSLALKEILGSGYIVYLNALLKAGIINTDGRYSTIQKKCKGYKINGHLFNASCITHKTITTASIKKAVIEHRQKSAEELKHTTKDLAHLTRWLTEDNLIMDKKSALEFVETYHATFIRQLKKRKLRPGFKRKQEAFLKLRYNLLTYQINNWQLSNGFSIDDKGGRLYSPLTSLRSIFRNFIYTKNREELVSLDIKNSQPLHFLFLLKNSFWDKKSTGLTIHKLLMDNPELLQLLKEEYNRYIMFPESSQTLTNQGLGIFSFPRLVVSGKLYEFISSKFSGKFITRKGIDRFKTRQSTKKELLQLMYFDPMKKSRKMIPVFEEFKGLFLQEAGLISAVKSKDYRNLPVLLQKIEAHVLLHLVAREVYLKDPTIPLYSIHDSLVTTSKHAETVRKILIDVYRRELGLIPQLEIKKWNELTADLDLIKYVNGKIDQANVEQKNPIDQQASVSENDGFEKEYVATAVPEFANIYHLTLPALPPHKNPFE